MFPLAPSKFNLRSDPAANVGAVEPNANGTVQDHTGVQTNCSLESGSLLTVVKANVAANATVFPGDKVRPLIAIATAMPCVF